MDLNWRLARFREYSMDELYRLVGAIYGGLGFSAVVAVACLYFGLSPMLYFVIPAGLLGMVLGLIFPEFFTNFFAFLFALFGL